MPRGVGRVVGEELDVDRRATVVPVDRAVDAGGAATGHHRGEHGEVGAVVGPTVAIVGVVERDAIVFEVDAQATVAEDAVAIEQVAIASRDRDAVARVARDDVALARVLAADDGVAGGDAHAGTAIAQQRHTVRSHADVVALHAVATRGAAADLDAVRTVARDHVACRGRAATHRGGLAAGQEDAHAGVAQRRRAAGVQAHDVALHSGCHAATDVDATAIVARHQVAGAGRRAADGDGAAVVHVQAVAGVAQVNGARDVGADLVALHRHRSRGGDPHAPVAKA